MRLESGVDLLYPRKDMKVNYLLRCTHRQEFSFNKTINVWTWDKPDGVVLKERYFDNYEDVFAMLESEFCDGE
jgi:hypothetical protein